jgi:hypothetical protein
MFEEFPLFKQSRGELCSKVENTREIVGIYNKEPNRCRYLKSFPCGLLMRTSIPKIILQFIIKKG